jgi:hypothetical protein
MTDPIELLKGCIPSLLDMQCRVTTDSVIGRIEMAIRLIETERGQAAACLGRKGGLKGGKARAEALSPDRRREIARQASRKRWNLPDGRIEREE